MSQGPLGVLNYAVKRTWAQLKAIAALSGFAAVGGTTGGVSTALSADPNGNLIISGVGGQATQLGFNTTQIVKAGPGMVVRVCVLIAGSAVGGVFDTGATAGLVTTADQVQQVATIPNTVGTLELNFPCLVGIVVQPGAGQVVSVSYQ